MRLRAFSIGCVLALSATALSYAQVVTVGGFTAQVDPQSGALALLRAGAGPLLNDLVVTARAGGRTVSSRHGPLRISTAAAEAGTTHVVKLDFGNGLSLALEASPDEVTLRANGRLEGPAVLRARSALGPNAIMAFLKDDAANDQSVLTTTLGPAVVPGARSLFDPARDLALTIASSGEARWVRGAGWELRASAPSGGALLTLRPKPHYYRDTLGVRYYSPIVRPKRWPTAPVVAMTWYGIRAMNGRPAQTMERLRPQIDWVAKYLRPYAGSNLVFQLDDNYPQDDDQAMRALSDYIRQKGLVPGIWFTPFAVAPKEEADRHPDWFLRDAQGKLIPTFGGISYANGTTLNVENQDAVEAWYRMWWRKASETWNYDFFKIDGQPDVVAAYSRAANAGGVEAYRQGLRIGRATVGPGKFINACWGTPVEAIGIVNGSRIGGDTGYDAHAINVLLQWNFLNNIAWYCDPDAAADLYRATVQRARLNAQARALTGQQFLTDDLWTQVTPEVRRTWQLSFPSLNIFPANLYPITDWRNYDLFDLKVAKPWGTWDVVGLMNYDGKPATKTLDLGRLRLQATAVHVYAYWGGSYLGLFRSDAKLAVPMAPYEGRLFRVTPAEAFRPAIVSTSRHVSQGGLDLERVRWVRRATGWAVRATSSHLVAGDPYLVAFAGAGYTATAARSSAGPVRIRRAGGCAYVSFVPRRDGLAVWEVTFGRARAARSRALAQATLKPTTYALRAQDNLALSATARASSVWSPEYNASRAIDGDPSTRWNSRQGDENGCWLELEWPAPVRIDRVVVDECIDFGPRIQEWRLLAGDDLQEVARGTGMGAAHVIRLPRALDTHRLRLVIDKATVTPTIWELQVPRARRER